MDVKKDREFTFTVGIRDEDLKNEGYRPEFVSDEELQEICDEVERIFQEDYWGRIFDRVCREVLRYNEEAQADEAAKTDEDEQEDEE